MASHIERRKFLAAVGSAAAAWPLAARAQQSTVPVIGFLDGQTFDPYLMAAFREALKGAGYIDGRNVAIYFRSADGQTDRLVTLAGDIVGRRVTVIVTTGGGAAAIAAYAATTTIPIVFVTGVDPVTSGLAMSLNRPGGNATGVYILQQVMEGKRLGPPAWTGSDCRVDRGVAQPDQCELSKSIEGCSGCRSRPRATSEHPERE